VVWYQSCRFAAGAVLIDPLALARYIDVVTPAHLTGNPAFA
jgi:hypothetical protein